MVPAAPAQRHRAYAAALRPGNGTGIPAIPTISCINIGRHTASAWPAGPIWYPARRRFRPPHMTARTAPKGCGGGDISPMNSSSSPARQDRLRARLRSSPPRLTEADPEIAAAIQGELGRQRHEIELIASENIVSRAVLEAQGSVMTNKYAEGYPGKRYYGGCEWVDVAETLAIERAKKLFGAQLRQCAAELRQPDEPGGVPGAAAARRHLHGPRSRRRRPSHPRLARQHVRQMVQGAALHRAPRGPDHRHGRGRASRPRR